MSDGWECVKCGVEFPRLKYLNKHEPKCHVQRPIPPYEALQRRLWDAEAERDLLAARVMVLESEVLAVQTARKKAQARAAKKAREARTLVTRHRKVNAYRRARMNKKGRTPTRFLHRFGTR